MSAVRAAPTGRPADEPPAAPDPESLSDPAQVPELLTTAGFADVSLTGLHHPMWFGAAADDAYEFLTGQFAGGLAEMTETTRGTALNSLRGTLVDHATSDGVVYDSAAWLITASRGGFHS